MTEQLMNALDDAMPALYQHCVSAYDAMLKRAERDEKTGVIIYEGFAVRLLTAELNLSSPYFSYCTKALKDMGCIKLVRRGGGRSPSLWHLIREPTPELWNKKVPEENKTSTDLIKKGLDRHAALQSRVDELTTKVVHLLSTQAKQQELIMRLALKVEELSKGKDNA